MQSESSGLKAAAGDLPAAARAYAQAGVAVFPLVPRGKRPATTNGFQDASSDPERVEAWWQATPTANIGVATGAPSRLLVLDVDPRHGGLLALKELERKHGRLPRTARSLTGGGGHHYFFRHPGGTVTCSTGALGDGLDVKADGGYIVAPPSIHESGNPYKWTRGGFGEPLATPPAWLLEQAQRRPNGTAPIGEAIPEGQRRKAMLTVAGKLKRAGLTGDEILPTLRELNRRCRPPLEESELESVAHHSTIAADPDSAVRTSPDASPRPLADVLAVFRRWMHLPDPASVEVTCAAIAANRIPSFDPTWLILVGAAGSGKTEALNATSRLDGVHVVATLTEAALLSGTPRKDTAAGASGGLLHEIGDSGVLILKDFGSILSMHREARAQVLAALREVYDGAWTRAVGVDGGRRLHWEGRVGIVAGATTVIDQHHAVMAQLGERFLIYRLKVDDAAAQGRSSLAHHGRERSMRSELAAAVAGLFASIDLDNPPPLSSSDTDRLVSLAVLVAAARSPVIRDSYRREIELVPDSEAPGRIVGALARLLTGLRLIGADEQEAWRVTVETGFGSMPAVRRDTLELLLQASEDVTTTDLSLQLGLPNPTAHRVLGDLAAHDVVGRISQGQGKPDLWRTKAWAAARYREATSSETSEEGLYSDFHTVQDDITEEVSS